MLFVGVFTTLGVLLAGCGSTPPPISTLVTPTLSLAPSDGASDPPTASPMPSPTAASATSTPAPTGSPPPPQIVTSDDGLLTLAIPDGALPAGVSVTATAQGESDLPNELVGLEVRSGFYLVEPEPLTFASPVEVTRRVSFEALDLDPDSDGLPLLALAVRSADARWTWLDVQELTTDGEFITAVGDALETGTLFAFGGTASTRADWSGVEAAVGSTVTVDIALAHPADSEDPPSLGAFEAIVPDGVVSAASSSTGPGGTSFRQLFRCDSPGAAVVGVRYVVDNIGAEALLFDELGLGAVSTNVTLTASISCSTAMP